METNEAILTREVVIIDARKKLGGIKALRVDYDTMAVSHYIVINDSTGTSLVLPFEKALAVGDTFITVQSRNDFLPADDAYANKVIQDGYILLNAKVFSKTGNMLSAVKSFEFDTVQGTITRILLEDGSIYGSETFIFFSPEFVFIDDGLPTAAELRSDPNAQVQTSFAPEPVSIPVAEPVIPEPVATPAPEPVYVPEPEPAPQPEPEAAPLVEEAVAPVIEVAQVEDDSSITDDEIVDFLVGTTLQADVESEDKGFKALQGTVLTREIIVEAAKHDAVLLLTINVEV